MHLSGRSVHSVVLLVGLQVPQPPGDVLPGSWQLPPILQILVFTGLVHLPVPSQTSLVQGFLSSQPPPLAGDHAVLEVLVSQTWQGSSGLAVLSAKHWSFPFTETEQKPGFGSFAQRPWPLQVSIVQ